MGLIHSNNHWMLCAGVDNSSTTQVSVVCKNEHSLYTSHQRKWENCLWRAGISQYLFQAFSLLYPKLHVFINWFLNMVSQIVNIDFANTSIYPFVCKQGTCRNNKICGCKFLFVWEHLEYIACVYMGFTWQIFCIVLRSIFRPVENMELDPASAGAEASHSV